MKSILLVKKYLGLVEMTSGLVDSSFSLPFGQAVKMIFFAPWLLNLHAIYRRTLHLFYKRGLQRIPFLQVSIFLMVTQ